MHSHGGPWERDISPIVPFLCVTKKLRPYLVGAPLGAHSIVDIVMAHAHLKEYLQRKALTYTPD